jgi:hypothetical protein
MVSAAAMLYYRNTAELSRLLATSLCSNRRTVAFSSRLDDECACTLAMQSPAETNVLK